MKLIQSFCDQPKKILLSKLLTNRPTAEQSITLRRDYAVPIAQDNKEINTYERQKDYLITKKEYKDIISASPHGRVHIFKYRNTQFTLIGTQFNHLPLKNIYKILINAAPDIILMQVRPDEVLQNFKLRISRDTSNSFSSSLYFQQITRRAEEVLPNAAGALELLRELAKDNIYMQSDAIEDEYDPFELYERIPTRVMSMVSLFAKEIPLVLADLPETVFRERIVNPRTIPQLQQFFTESARQCGQNPDILPNTPLNLSYFTHPDVFLRDSDSYITSLIEFMAAKNQYKRVCVFLGHGQSDSITHLLDNKQACQLEQQLQTPLIRGSILKDIGCEDLVERYAIMDVMKYGNAVNLNSNHFQTTYRMIDRMADPHKVNKNRVKEMRYLHLEMLRKYQQELEKQYAVGQKYLQNEYMIKGKLI